MEFINICTQGQHFNSLVKHHPKTFTILLPHRPEREEEKEKGQYGTKKFQNQYCLEYKNKNNTFTNCFVMNYSK